ncbi:MAG: PEP-CTERM sorting domain-containing protein [Gammaproteobacteria bacterium]|nr:PEP-CTERM sorting domain-containing protein [Gammaproteobacteria bacterium]
MKNRFLKGLLASFILSVSGMANAGLILNITDDGFGGTRWQLSGSTIASSTYSQNSIWAWNISNMVNTSVSGLCVGLSSGSGSMFSTTSGTVNIFDVCSVADYGSSFDLLSARVGSITFAIGDIVSWTGNFTTSVAFASLNQGTYTTKSLYNFSTNQMEDFLTINIGRAPSVPAPSTVAIFALGLLGLAVRRGHKRG